MTCVLKNGRLIAMNNIRISTNVGIVSMSLLVPYISQAGERPKNIILILADDMGYECVGAYGSTYQTPNLDGLARQGILYTNCFSQPLSTPTRVQLMTGKYNCRNYVEFGYMNPEMTFGNIAKDAGYSTCIVGKWQLGADHTLPGRFGFDEYCLWQLEKGAREGARDRYANVAIECEKIDVERSIDIYGPDIFDQYALDFIERNKDKPFLLYYPNVLVHAPFTPTPDSSTWENVSKRKKSNKNNFPDMVSYIDKSVGRIVGKLKELSLYDDTVIIFIGDNGTKQGIRTRMKDGSYISGGKGKMTDAGTHVPMIVWYPNGKNNSRISDALVDMTDFLPTIADIVGTRVKQKWNIDGHSLYNQFRGFQNAFERKWVFCHYDPLKGQIPSNYSGRFARNAAYKLYHDGRLYDMSKDLLEQNPISEQDVTRDVKRNKRRLERVLSKFPDWKPGYPGAAKMGDYNPVDNTLDK